MKISMTCPKCGSPKIQITSEEDNPTPMYQCKACGNKGKLFPGFDSDKSNKKKHQDDDEVEEESEESFEDEDTEWDGEEY